jgi:membrane protein
MTPTPLYQRLRAFVWDGSLEGLPPWRVAFIEACRIAWVVGRDLIDGRLNLRAMSLVYTTLLSLVPTIAIAFAVFRAFGYDVYVRNMLTEFLGPLGAEGSEVTAKLMEFVDRVNANVLGTVGFAFLLYTVISMVNKIEEAFNNIWHVQSSRSLARQFTEVVSVGVLGPLVFFTALGIMAGALSNSYVGTLIDFR